MTFGRSRTGTGMKKNIPKIREWESEAIIPGNTWEGEQEWKNGLLLLTGQWYAPSAVINEACCCMVLHGIALYCMVLHGIALYYMVLHGIA